MFREVPANPNIRVYHCRQEMTRATAEIYRSVEEASERPLANGLLHIRDVIEVCFFRYQVRLRKSKDAEWESLELDVESLISAAVSGTEVIPFSPDEHHREFVLPDCVEAFDRLVFEGCEWAEKHPLARELFKIDGVVEAIFEGKQITLKKGRCFDWDHLSPAALQTIADYFRGIHER